MVFRGGGLGWACKHKGCVDQGDQGKAVPAAFMFSLDRASLCGVALASLELSM